ncbi:Hypothetical predicted protein [Paramuricea clavata]|uniref:Uncharacterized protein n=1 Tax=Paramuricea clavata TaxID=317549 RepID=A0A7D9DW77_PARCT|nr:Hypothetical predicted protein [Paramuricea clavata]
MCAKTCSEAPEKSRYLDEIPNSENTTEAIQKEHISELHKETQKSANSQDKNKVKTLMASTFQLRRKEILTTLTPVSKIIETYPPLATISGIRHEFSRIFEDNAATKEMKDKLFSLQSAIVKYCENVQRKNPFIKNALHDLQRAISQEPEKTQGDFDSSCMA